MYILIHINYNKAITYNTPIYENTANNNVANQMGTIVLCFLPNPNSLNEPSLLYSIAGFNQFIPTNIAMKTNIATDK
jgi:hypothetical protein